MFSRIDFRGRKNALTRLRMNLQEIIQCLRLSNMDNAYMVQKYLQLYDWTSKDRPKSKSGNGSHIVNYFFFSKIDFQRTVYITEMAR